MHTESLIMTDFFQHLAWGPDSTLIMTDSFKFSSPHQLTTIDLLMLSIIKISSILSLPQKESNLKISTMLDLLKLSFQQKVDQLQATKMSRKSLTSKDSRKLSGLNALETVLNNLNTKDSWKFLTFWKNQHQALIMKDFWTHST